MGKLWSGFRTLTDNCRRLFKRHPAELHDNKTTRDVDNWEVEDVNMDSNTQISVKIFPEKIEISQALVDVIVQELKEFQTKSGIPNESDQRKLKGTLLLRLSINTEDYSNICAKLLCLCNSKIKGELMDYCINVTLHIKPGEKVVVFPHTSVTEECRSLRPNLGISSKPFKTTTISKGISGIAQLQICDSSKTANLIEFQTDNKQGADDKTTDNALLQNPDNPYRAHPADIRTGLNKKQSFKIEQKKNSFCTLSSQENCHNTHPIINMTRSNQQQTLETGNWSFRSECEVPYGVTDHEPRVFNFNGANKPKETLTDNEKLKDTHRVIADSSSSICGSDMQVKSKEILPDTCIPTEPLYTDPRIKATSSPRTGGWTPGIDADAVMSRLSRVVRSCEESCEWKKHIGTKQDNSYAQSLRKSFIGTGILNHVREELSGLKRNELWITETMRDARNSACLISYVHKYEFYALHKKFPELILFDDYVRAKEKQLGYPSVRRKYIGLILYGSLGNSFEEKFPDLAKEIDGLDCLKCYLSFCSGKEEPDPQSIPRLRKKCKAKRKIAPGTQSKKDIRSESIENVNESSETQHTQEGVVDPNARDLGNDLGSAPDKDEKDHNESDHEQLGKNHSGGNIANPRVVSEHTEGKSDTRTTSATTGHRTASTYEENWTFEKDGISSLDDRIRIKRYGKGAKKRFEEPKVKVKTRGVANRHITPIKQEILTEDAPDLSPGNTLYEVLCNLSTKSGGCKDFQDTCKEQSSDKPCLGSGENEPDVRHVGCVPSTIIMGKKKEFEELGDRYGATESYTDKATKNRKQPKKQQRANKIFHLENLNNSALAESESDDVVEDSHSAGEIDDNSQGLTFISEILTVGYDDMLSSQTFTLNENKRKFTKIPSEPWIMKAENIKFKFYSTTTYISK